MTYCLDPISIQNPHQLFQGIGYEISFWCETIGSQFRVQGMISFWYGTFDLVSGHRVWNQFLMWNDWIAIQGTGHEIIRVQGVVQWGGDSLYKGEWFSLLLLFSIPSHLTLNSFTPPLNIYLFTCLPTLKISFVLLVKPVVPPSGTWKVSNVSSLVPPLRTQYVFSLFLL
jgi:hypothetical protein